jgi:hypothetical protein
MKNSIIAYSGWLLLITAFGFYAYGIIHAIQVSWGSVPITKEYNEVLSATIGSIQALLLTNLGMLLGISVANPSSTVARHLMLGRPIAQEQAISLAVPPPLEVKEKVQLFALVIFIISLIACLITWAVDDFISKPEQVVSVVASSGKMFVGVVLAYLTAVVR